MLKKSRLALLTTALFVTALPSDALAGRGGVRGGRSSHGGVRSSGSHGGVRSARSHGGVRGSRSHGGVRNGGVRRSGSHGGVRHGVAYSGARRSGYYGKKHRYKRHYGGHGYRGYRYRPAGYGFWPALTFGLGVGVGHGLLGHGPSYASTSYVVSPAPVTHVTHSYAAPTGKLDIDVVPNTAVVYLDGVPVGTADDFDGWPRKLHVEGGEHTLHLVESGFEAATVVVAVAPGHTQKIRLRLVPLPAGADPARSMPPQPLTEPPYIQQRAPAYAQTSDNGLTLNVSPPGATVYIDGEHQAVAGAGPLIIGGLPPGLHDLEVLKPGFKTYRSQILVPAGQAALSLTIQLETAPKGAPIS